MNQYSNQWPQDRLDELKRLAARKDLSTYDIAREMGISASAIIGKIHRLGLNKSIPERAARSGLGNGGKVVRKATVQQKRASTRSAGASISNAVRRITKRSAPVTSFTATAKTSEPFVARSSGEAVARCGLLDLKSDSCRWPFGDPREKDFHFCGGKAIEGGPYCGVHAQHAWVRR